MSTKNNTKHIESPADIQKLWTEYERENRLGKNGERLFSRVLTEFCTRPPSETKDMDILMLDGKDLNIQLVSGTGRRKLILMIGDRKTDLTEQVIYMSAAELEEANTVTVADGIGYHDIQSEWEKDKRTTDRNIKKLYIAAAKFMASKNFQKLQDAEMHLMDGIEFHRVIRSGGPNRKIFKVQICDGDATVSDSTGKLQLAAKMKPPKSTDEVIKDLAGSPPVTDELSSSHVDDVEQKPVW